jgi:hypothetical protein
MSFNQKIIAIEEARKLYPEFDQKFTDYLGLGNSFNGAYNHFTIDDIKKYEPNNTTTIVTAEKTVEPVTKPTTKAAVRKTATK